MTLFILNENTTKEAFSEAIGDITTMVMLPVASVDLTSSLRASLASCFRLQDVVEYRTVDGTCVVTPYIQVFVTPSSVATFLDTLPTAVNGTELVAQEEAAVTVTPTQEEK